MDFKEVIRDLISKGMDQTQVIQTLKEMGLENAETVVAEALIPKEPIVPVETVVNNPINTIEDASLSSKLDVLISLNKQILESQRQILLKLK